MNRHNTPEESRESDPSDAFFGEVPDEDFPQDSLEEESPNENSLEEESPNENSPEEESPNEAPLALSEGTVVSREALERAARSFATLRDLPSFTLLCQGIQRALLDVVQRAGVDDHDAEEVVNQAFFAVWTRRETLRGGAYKQFVCFARTTARRRAVEWQRQNAWWRQNVFLADDPNEHCVGEDDCDDTVPTPEELVAAREALSVLSPREQLVVNARAEGMTWKETAAEARVSVVRVQQIHAAALRRMHPEDA